MKPFDTDKMPWLFTPHGDGELNEYFSTDHSKIIAETSKEVLASLSESRDRLSGKLCYEFHYNQRRYKYTLLQEHAPAVCGYDRPCRCDDKNAEKAYHGA